jgi:hypothetical protein
MKRKLIMGLLVLLATANNVFSAPLKVVTVGAPAVNCVFDPTCRITVSDSIAPIPIAISGTSFLQSRTFTGKPGAPANGYFAYEYRIDLTQATSTTSPPQCIRSLTVPIGPVISLDYNGDHISTDQVYVVTQGGLGTISIASANQDAAGNVTFNFSSPVCPGTPAAGGQTTYFFGLVSQRAPVPVTATITEVSGSVHNIAARAPNPVTTTACGIPGYSPAFWNDAGTIQYHNNCYNYGNNKRTDTFAQPGRYAGAQATVMQCPNVIAGAVADGLIQTTATGVCPTGMDKIAMVVDPGNDYHWYRQGSDGMWTHKPGGGQATNLDSSNVPISNPETANRCGGGLCYSQFCAYFCTCSDVQQGQGHATIN